MKRYFFLAVGIAVLLSIAISVQPMKAQVYGAFNTVKLVTQVSYQELVNDNVLNPAGFALPPNFTPTDRDDGYQKFQLPFPFDYNNTVYTDVWVNVNGFIMFTANGEFPPNVGPDVPKGLFISSSSYPTNVVAPYWGDHYLRTTQDRFAGYIASRISWSWENYDQNYRVIIIQWKDLNINDENVKSSVGNFQVRLYESKDPLNHQGDIEFCYGKVGSRDLHDSVGNLVVTRGASIGIKGATTLAGGKADYMNGLEYDMDAFTIRTSQRLTVEWPPSLATDNRIKFTSVIVHSEKDWWGDGDADMTKSLGRKHYLMPQNRYVTVNDARMIMRAVATQRPLDSVWGREAYHGDVTHNGRYYYDNYGERQDIPWRDMYFSLNLPSEIDDSLRVFFQVTEYDASYILHYLAARIPVLPWIVDTVVKKGKIGIYETPASAISFGKAKLIDNGVYNIPIYINGYIDGPMGIRFDVNAEVVDVTGIEATFNGSRVVIATDGEFNANEPICFVTVKTNNPEITAINIRFNDNNAGTFTAKLTETDNSVPEILLQNEPNPFTLSTKITFNIQTQGYYTLAVYDAFGNKVKTLMTGSVNPGVVTQSWDGTDEFGNKVNSGVYIYRLVGDELSIAKKLVLSR